MPVLLARVALRFHSVLRMLARGLEPVATLKLLVVVLPGGGTLLVRVPVAARHGANVTRSRKKSEKQQLTRPRTC